jgi:tape measure domain-containing protein
VSLRKLYVVLGAKVDGWEKGIAQAEKSLRRIERSTRDMDRSLAGLNRSFALAGAAASAAFGLAAKAGMDFNSKMQQADISFTTMLGSAQKAKVLLSDLQQFAAKTPFEFPELADASKKMLAFGFAAEKIMPTLKAVGDAAAGLGGGSEAVQRIITALGQMQAKSKVSAEEMLQLTEAGIPAWDILAKAIGKSTAETMKLAEKGVIPASAAVDALVKGMGERFPDMMDKQAKSFSGLMSTLKDTANMAFGQVMKPAFDWLTEKALPVAIERAKRFTSTLQSLGTNEAFKTILPPIVVDTITGFFTFIANNGAAVKAALAGIGAALLALEVRLVALKAAAIALNLVGFLLTPTGLVVTALGLLAAGVVAVNDKLNESRQATANAASGFDGLLYSAHAVNEELRKTQEYFDGLLYASHKWTGVGKGPAAQSTPARQSAAPSKIPEDTLIVTATKIDMDWIQKVADERAKLAKDFKSVLATPAEIEEPTVREQSFWHSDTWRVLSEAVIRTRALMKEPLEIDEPRTPSGGPNMGGMMADWVRNVWKPRREAALEAEKAAAAQEDAIARYQMAMGRLITVTYQADQAWAKFAVTASDAITGILEGTKTLGEVLEGIFKTKAHNSIKEFVDDALDSFRDLRKQGTNAFQAIGEAIKTNFKNLDLFGGMGIGMTAGAAIGGSQSGSVAGSVIGGLLGGPIGAIAGGFLGGLFGPTPKPQESKPQPQSLDALAGNLDKVWKTSARVSELTGTYHTVGRSEREVADYRWVDVPINPVIDQAVLDKIKAQIGTTLDSMGQALGSAFDTTRYEDFTAKFGQNLEATTKKALISAFMASDAIRPLLDNLSNVISQAVLDGKLSDAERQSIVGLYSQITAQSSTFYQALQDLGIATEGVAGNMDALGEALRNVPTGFKVAAARWDVSLPKYHSGGYVPEDGPALLRKGEVVLTPEQQRAGGGSSGLTIIINGDVHDWASFQRKVEKASKEIKRSNGLAAYGLAGAGA